jgi:hypothetical protein
MAISGTVRAMALVLMMSASIAEQSAAQQPTQENVSKEVTNPIAFLMIFTLENDYSPSLWGSRGEQNEVQGEAVIPFEAFRNQNLFRIKVVFETSSPMGLTACRSRKWPISCFSRDGGEHSGQALPPT